MSNHSKFRPSSLGCVFNCPSGVKILPLSFLPNEEGFEFKGVTVSGELLDCYVKKSFEGQYIALSKANNERVFNRLTGWVR